MFRYDKKRAALSRPTLARSTILRRAVAADPGPPVQPNKASSTDERLPDLWAILAATTLQSRARGSLLATLARRQAFSVGPTAKIENERFRFGGNREPQLMWPLVIRHLRKLLVAPRSTLTTQAQRLS
jgi:hypothetical protein